MLQQKPSLIGFSIQHPHQFFPRKSRLPMMLPNDAAQIRFPYCWSWLVVLHYNDQQLKLQSLWWSPMCTSFLLLGFGYINSWPHVPFVFSFVPFAHPPLLLYASGHEITRLGWHTSSPAQGFATAWWPCLFWCISEHHGQCVDGYGSGAWRAMRITTFWAGHDFKMNVSDHSGSQSFRYV